MPEKLSILEIPEIAGLDSRGDLVRIPPEIDVPLTGRVRKIIDTAAFRRLARISQLGLVSLVYPAAHHTRFEHSLGVYRLALLLLKRLAYDPRFTKMVSKTDAELFIAASLLHDIGHWPFCHPIEDIRLEGILDHETAANRFLLQGELAEVLRSNWNIEPETVCDLLNKGKRSQSNPAMRLLSSILSGPIDIDKMDYLFRDSLHAGVPYGRHFDQNRLIASVCLNESGDGLAITDKGKTAAELMVFARYVMFNEVYWHHGVRSATAMLQRAFYILFDRIDMDKCFSYTEQKMIDVLRDTAMGTEAETLIEGLFGDQRNLCKRVAQFSVMEQPEHYKRLIGKPYNMVCDIAEKMRADTGCGQPLLIDAPPIEREVEFRISVFYPKENRYRSLESASPVVRSLAREQFDDYVKRVRIFAPTELVAHLHADFNVADWIMENIP